MKNFVFIFLGLFLMSCNSNDDNQSSNENDLTYLKYSVKLKNNPNEVISINEFTFDDQGKVIIEDYTNLHNPQYNYHSTFEYDNNGRILKEIRNGETFFNIVWSNYLAEVYNVQNQKIGEYNFSGETLTDYKIGFNVNDVQIKNLNYDANQNIVSIANESEVYVEYLDYDVTKKNPYNYLKSIGILRIDHKPFFKNIFHTEKVYPFEGEDFSQPLTFYDYHYEFDSENRVYQIENEKSLIYIVQFEYE